LYDNALTTLPAGIFEGLTALEVGDLRGLDGTGTSVRCCTTRGCLPVEIETVQEGTPNISNISSGMDILVCCESSIVCPSKTKRAIVMRNLQTMLSCESMSL
ncbi:unnamed protein product, partial [Pylaiella littoralis]